MALAYVEYRFSISPEAEEQLLLSGYAALALTGDILPAFGVALQDDL